MGEVVRKANAVRRKAWQKAHCLAQNSFKRGRWKRLPTLASTRHTGWQKRSLGRVGRRRSGQRRVDQHHERLVSRHSHQHLRAQGKRSKSPTVQKRKNRPTDDSPSSQLRNAEEVAEEGPP